MGTEQCTIPSYTHVEDGLCTYGKLLLRVTRIVVPNYNLVRLVHEGHHGGGDKVSALN